MSGPLEVSAVSMRFGGLTALKDVSLSVQPGCIHAVIGPNGSGKTTLFNVISGVYPPSQDTIRFRGESMGGRSMSALANKGLGRTFQNTRVFASMTVLENVRLARYATGAAFRFTAAERRRADEILDFIGLQHIAGDSAASLPQGQRRLL